MNRANQSMRHFAKRLQVFEARGNKSSTSKTPAVFSISAKLRPQLATLIGDGGYQALLARALARASAEVPWLRGVRVKTDGVIEYLAELPAQPGADEYMEGETVLLAELLGLLVAFIGKNLTLCLAQKVWPKVPLSGLDLDLDKKDKNEKTK